MKPPVLKFPFAASDGQHECRVELHWLGSERYYVDDTLVLRQWSLLGKTAMFNAHGVEIQVRSRLENRQGVMEVLLNNKVVIKNLLEDYNSELNAKLRKFGLGSRTRTGPGLWLAKVGVWAVLAFLFFTLYKWLERNAA